MDNRENAAATTNHHTTQTRAIQFFKYGLMLIGGVAIAVVLLKFFLLWPLKVFFVLAKTSILNSLLLAGFVYQYAIGHNEDLVMADHMENGTTASNISASE